MHTTYLSRLMRCIFRLPLPLPIVMLCVMQHALADDYFNPALLDIDNPVQNKTDLTVFEKGPGLAPGKYRVNIFINNKQTDSHEVDFYLQKASDGTSSLQPCLSVKMLQGFGILTDHYPQLAKGEKCTDLSLIPGASATFHLNQQQLLLSIPQADIGQVPRGYIAPEEYDEGINAGLLNYSFNASHSHARQSGMSNNNSEYLNLRPGLNVGAWRLRNYSTWNRSDSDNSSQSSFSSVYSYAKRDIIPLRSQLTAGQSSTPADVFDSVPFTGVQMASDDDMKPDSEKGYAPIIRGIAHSNAQVVVRQNGYIIYQNSVAPGAFMISDLYPTGSSGDLDVTVKETDGSEQHFVVPFASVPVLQREKSLRYHVIVGKYRSYDRQVEKTPLAQSSVIYGLPYGFTVYGGFQQSNHYQSQAIGLGKNIGDLGAFSLDITHAKALLKDQAKSTGNSWRARYSKSIAATHTNFSIAGYRYNSKGFYTLQDTLDSWTSNDDWSAPDQRRSRTEMTVDQPIGNSLGSLTLSLVREHYWNQSENMTSLGLGYNNSWHGISYGLNYSLSENTGTTDGNSTSYSHDNQFSVSVSIPLDYWMQNTWATYNLNSSKNNTTHSIGLSGTSLANNNLNWNIQEGLTSSGNGNTTSLNTDYKGTYGEVNAGYSQDSYQRNLTLGAQGGIVVHANGITLGQPLGETIALVKAPGVSGTQVMNQTGVKTDYRGYTIVPYLSAYRHTTLALDLSTLPANADLTQATQIVTPTRGAVVRASFKPRIGEQALIVLTHRGKPLPFGASVTITDGNVESIVGDNGQVYLSGLKEQGVINARWGEDTASKCIAHYQLPTRESGSPVINLAAECR